ncbi:PREDICTED: putative disease resistance protein RGA3 [Prunus mume]|uniref:Disease resistance protein RGA3 n=1 Tax=Prunus mume TaxID=102107 RepID=A0ABM1LJE7_PRUMU|nr:PREDICTED: putative disease resistance protein RGA3 [Prunus mume]XP_016647523.1 PREDICTED: putative disease resistance protein RGA3 [Prunus mume]XP_016647524.1 PREDICTED: putative disease resistance protein RGA3 [Prunus mume]
MADALISVLLERLVSITYEYVEGELKHVLNVKEDVKKFTRTLRVIRAVLEDAEQRQVTDRAVKIWLDELKDISYQMVDVLDEWNTDILKQQVEKQEGEGDPTTLVTKMKVCFSSFFSCFSCFCFGKVSRVFLRHDIALKIKDLNDELTKINKEREDYQFLSKELGIQQPQRPQTASFVDISEIFGRETEKEDLITNLLSDSSAEGKGLLIIPIVGMGGMGKTTLTQLAYNDDNVKAHFEIRKWVCVSDPFDEIKIAKDISGDCATSSNQLDYVLQRMSESIQGKRFLLVLDDVWTENRQKWELLKVPLMQNGAKGSIILVTTRKIEVANMMRAIPNMIKLKGLSDEYCLAIFNHMAFPDGDVDESKAFEDISKKIVKKCEGLPLAAKTLGSLMRNKRTKREWKEVLNSKIWDLEKVEQEVFQPLLLSYYDLSPTIKCCLLYCATFPKDYTFERDRLIELWMAQDYVISKWNKQKGTTGDVVFDNLVARSFLQDFQKDPDTGTITGCKMHDIVHDFVQFLTKNECLIMDHTECATSESKLLGDKVRHLTLRYFVDGPLAISSNNCQKLRTLATFDSRITTIDSNLILQLKCLRTLNSSRNSMKELPKEIGELIHLRHIDLSYNNYLEKLPDTICGLYNLSTLRLVRCSKLKKLPENMGNLINLKHLYVDWCEDMKSLPKGIGRLTSLQTLDVCPCGGDNDEAFQIGDMRMLNLEGSLVIQLVGDATDKSEVEKAQLWDKKLFHLTVHFERQTNSSSSSVEILNALRPHPDLESLQILHHNGTTWPNWIQSLKNLRFLTLVGGTQCELWPLGKLEYLERLTLLEMVGVRKVGVEFLGLEDQTSFRIRSPQISFPKLKQLSFALMWNWEEWEGVEEWTKEDSEITIMPCLSKLDMEWCPLLQALPDFLFKTPLQTLRIRGSERLLERYQEGNGEWAKISATNPNIRIIRDSTEANRVL